MYTQNDAYGCGLYAVANACNLPEGFVTKERLEASKIGNNTGQLSAWLQQDGFNFYLQPEFYDRNVMQLPDQHTAYIINGDVMALPVILTCKLSENGLQHMIAGHLDISGDLYVYDSLRQDVFRTTLKGIKDHYYAVFGLYTFCDLETSQFLFIS